MLKANLYFIVFSLLILQITGCSNTPCKIEERPPMAKIDDGGKTLTSNKDLTKRVRVYKTDGSLQCGMGQRIGLKDMASEQLPNIQIFSSENKHDGLMRIQVCGQPTGTCNVYEILEADFEQATKLGFKKWNRD